MLSPLMRLIRGFVTSIIDPLLHSHANPTARISLINNSAFEEFKGFKSRHSFFTATEFPDSTALLDKGGGQCPLLEEFNR